MSIVQKYPLDLTGQSSTNLIQQEAHQLSNNTNRSLIPSYSPFYIDSLVITDKATGEELTAHDQYEGILYYEEPSVLSAQEVMGGVVITDPTVSSNVEVRYQTVGGPYFQVRGMITSLVEDLDLDERPVQWGDLFDKPNFYPAAEHMHDVRDIIGFNHLVNTLDQIREAVLYSDVPMFDELATRIADRHDEMIRRLEDHKISRDHDYRYVNRGGDIMYGKLTIDDRLNVVERATFDDAVRISGALTAESPATLQSTLDVQGVSTLAVTNIEDVLTVSAAATFDASTVFNDVVRFNSNTRVMLPDDTTLFGVDGNNGVVVGEADYPGAVGVLNAAVDLQVAGVSTLLTSDRSENGGDLALVTGDDFHAGMGFENWLVFGTTRDQARHDYDGVIEGYGGTSSAFWAVQDGNGRSHFYWNVKPNSQEIISSNEGASWVEQNGGGYRVSLYAGQENDAGGFAVWTSVIDANLNRVNTPDVELHEMGERVASRAWVNANFPVLEHDHTADILYPDRIRANAYDGKGTETLITAGEFYSAANGNANGEWIWLAAEQGVRAVSSPDNLSSGWGGRHQVTLIDSNGESHFNNLRVDNDNNDAKINGSNGHEIAFNHGSYIEFNTNGNRANLVADRLHLGSWIDNARVNDWDQAYDGRITGINFYRSTTQDGGIIYEYMNIAIYRKNYSTLTDSILVRTSSAYTSYNGYTYS